MPDPVHDETLARVLGAAFDEFEVLRLTARHWADRDADLFPAFLSAGTAAAGGRDAVTAAPSFPAGQPPPPPPAAIPAPDAAAAADLVTARAAGLAGKLEHAAAAAGTAADARACREGAAAARQIRDLMTGADASDCR